jgi:hypothetical protein
LQEQAPGEGQDHLDQEMEEEEQEQEEEAEEAIWKCTATELME